MSSTLENAESKETPSLLSRIIAFAVVAIIAVLGAIWLQETLLVEEEKAPKTEEVSSPLFSAVEVEEAKSEVEEVAEKTQEKAAEVASKITETVKEAEAKVEKSEEKPDAEASTEEVSTETAESATEQPSLFTRAVNAMVGKTTEVAESVKHAVSGEEETAEATTVAAAEVAEEEASADAAPTVAPMSPEETFTALEATNKEKFDLMRDVLKKEMTRRRSVEEQLATTVKKLEVTQGELQQTKVSLANLQSQISALRAGSMDANLIEPAAGATTIINLRDAYMKGEPTEGYMAEAINASKSINRPTFIVAVKEIEKTVQQQPVTQLQMLNLTQQVLSAGAPIAARSEEARKEVPTENWYDSITNLVSVRKISEVSGEQTWRMGVHELQNLIVANRVAEAQKLLTSNMYLKDDARLAPLSGMLSAYANQQAAFNTARSAVYVK